MDKELQTLELAEKSVFEQLFALIEKHRINPDPEKLKLGNFYDLVSEFDGIFGKFNYEGQEKQRSVYNEILTSTFQKFIDIFSIRGFRDEALFHAFKKYIAYFSALLKISGNVLIIEELASNIYDQIPSLKMKFGDLQWISKAYFSKASENNPLILFEVNFCMEIGISDALITKDERLHYDFIHLKRQQVKNYQEKTNFYVLADGFTERELVWDSTKNQFSVSKYLAYYTTMEISIDSRSVSQELNSLTLIATAIEKIKNTTIELLSIEKGSIRAKWRIWFKDLVAKEEFKAMTATAKEIAIKSSTGVSYAEIQKSRWETEKLKMETEILKMEATTAEQKQNLEIKRLEIENAKAEVELIKMLSELMSKGIIEADSVRININSIMYLLKGPEQQIEGSEGDIDKLTG